nr:Ycf60 [Madagascaria erythrocladioides]
MSSKGIIKQNTIKLYFISIISTLFIIATVILLYQKIFPETKLFKKQKENTNQVLLSTRFISILPYFLPLLEGCEHFAQRVTPDYPFKIVRLYRQILKPMVVFYTENRFVNFISFLTLYFLLVSSKSPLPVSKFLRFNTLQALLIFLITTILGVTFKALPVEFRMSLYGGIICNTFFLFILYTIGYSLLKIGEGEYADIPVVSEAVNIQINSKGI